MKYIVIRESMLEGTVKPKDSIVPQYTDAMQNILTSLRLWHSYDIDSAEEFLNEGFSPYVDELSGTCYYDSVTPAVVEQYAALCVGKYADEQKEKCKNEYWKGWLVGYLTSGTILVFLGLLMYILK